jgi:DNA modification methylase
MRRPILNNSRRGDTIYDPFLGSGTLLVAAEVTDRICYGLDIDPHYVDVIVTRWQKLTGKQATLEGDGRTFDEITEERKSTVAQAKE